MKNIYVCSLWPQPQTAALFRLKQTSLKVLSLTSRFKLPSACGTAAKLRLSQQMFIGAQNLHKLYIILLSSVLTIEPSLLHREPVKCKTRRIFPHALHRRGAARKHKDAAVRHQCHVVRQVQGSHRRFATDQFALSRVVLSQMQSEALRACCPSAV